MSRIIYEVSKKPGIGRLAVIAIISAILAQIAVHGGFWAFEHIMPVLARRALSSSSVAPSPPSTPIKAQTPQAAPQRTGGESSVQQPGSLVTVTEAGDGKTDPSTTTVTQAEVSGQAYTPPPGSPERKAIMDAIRPHAERIAGQPVIFRVVNLEVRGNRALAVVAPMSKDGKRPPGVDGTDFSLEVDLVRSDSGWMVTHIHEIIL